MSQRTQVLVALLLALCGAVASAPLLVGHLRFRMTPGRVLEAFVRPVGDGQARLEMVYEYQVPYRGKIVVPLGYQQGRDFKPVADPVMPLDEAQERMESLRRHPHHMVFYRANDPEGTAFITIGSPTTAWRNMVGPVLVILALALYLAAARRPGRR